MYDCLPFFRGNNLYWKICVESDRLYHALLINIGDARLHTRCIFARCEFTISAYGALIKVDELDLACSPANYRHRIYGVYPVISIGVSRNVCIYVTQEMTTDER